MNIEIQLVREPIPANSVPAATGAHGAWLDFRGVVRDEENGRKISALEYEAYPEMAAREIRRLLEEISSRHPCLAAKVIHRLGTIPVGETAIYVGVASGHRGEAIALLAEFMDKLKQDVPIWKRRALPVPVGRATPCAPSGASGLAAPHAPSGGGERTAHPTLQSLDDALAEIRLRCPPLLAVRAPLAECLGRVLRETVCAPTDFPDCDRSTRDGYAILQSDASEVFHVMDTLHAADWKPRALKTGEAVRIATGAACPCDHVQVVMQEHVVRTGDQIRITKREAGLNLRQRGEDVKAGQPLLPIGVPLHAGKLALLAAAGNTRPLVSPRLRVVHFTTGDEIIPPQLTPKPGQVRDSNSILIRGLLEPFSCHLEQAHLPENFEFAKSAIAGRPSAIENADVLLVSGGASVGEKDFTGPLLESLGFAIVFSQVNVRPGRPLIFAVSGGASASRPDLPRQSEAAAGLPAVASGRRRVPASRLAADRSPSGKLRIAFGLPGNPLSHFVCFHVFVAAALQALMGSHPQSFRRGVLAEKFDEAPIPRETLWPARRDSAGLHPLVWASSGDVTCLVEADALIRVPPNTASFEAGAEVHFLPAGP